MTTERDTKTSRESTFRLLLSQAGKSKPTLAASIALAVLGVAAGLGPYVAVSVLITELMKGTTSLNFILVCAFSVLTLYALNIIFNAFSTALSHRAAFTILKNLRTLLANKLSRLPMGYVLDTPSGKIKNLLLDIVEKLELPLAHIIPEMTANLLGPLGMLAYLFYLDYRLALASLATVPIGAVCFLAMLKDYGPRYEKVTRATANMNAAIVEYVNGLEVIRVFNQSTSSYGKYVSAVEANRDSILEWFKETCLYFTVGLTVVPSSLAVVLPLGGWFYFSGSLSPDTLVTILILSMGLMRPLISALEYTDSLAMVDSSVKAINKLLMAPDLVRPSSKASLNGSGLEFENVYFAYDSKDVLKGLTFKAPHQSLTAIVGPSGSGKSTVARLAASFWEVNSGSIKLCGCEVKTMPLCQVMELVSYVSQENFLFNQTVRENIRFGKPEATDQEVMEAAKAGGCHDFIIRLENGYDTLVGEAGGRLSGGERQRVAISRAILKDSPIVVLDEATAFADPDNEAIIQESFSRLVKDKTVLLIAHRLSTITSANQIIVMDEGEIKASGRHDELLKTSPLYQNMWEAHIRGKDRAERTGCPEAQAHV
jgi:ATP-binding cassette subfamily B protein